MPKRSSIRPSVSSKAREGDTPPRLLDKDTQTEKNPHAVALGRLGGQKGGPARAEKLTGARRSQIASMAAKARWHQR